jgi:hypothetical protein
MAKANLKKGHKRYKDFVDKSRQKVNFEEGDEVWLNIKKISLAKRFEPQVLWPICGPIQSVGREIS